MNPPFEDDGKPILVRERKRRPRDPRRPLRTLWRFGMRAAIASLTGCVMLAIARPFVLAYQTKAELGRLQAMEAELEVQNAALRQRIHFLNTPTGIEIEARRLGWVRPGEIPIQILPPATSPPKETSQPNVQPAPQNLLVRAYHLACRALKPLRHARQKHREPQEE